MKRNYLLLVFIILISIDFALSDVFFDDLGFIDEVSGSKYDSITCTQSDDPTDISSLTFVATSNTESLDYYCGNLTGTQGHMYDYVLGGNLHYPRLRFVSAFPLQYYGTYVFNDELYIYENSNITIDYLIYAPLNLDVSLLLFDSVGDCKVEFKVTPNRFDFPACDDVLELNCEYNANYLNCVTNETLASIKYMTFALDDTGGTNGIWFANLTMHNVTSIENSLPTIDLFETNKSTYCINETQSSITMNFNIETTDEEGDTILYSLDSFKNFVQREVFREDFAFKDNQGNCKNDYDIFGDTILINQTYNPIGDFSNWLFSVNGNGVSLDAFYSGNDCLGSLKQTEISSPFYVDFKKPFYNINEVTSLLSFPVRDVSTNISFLTTDYSEIFSLIINKTSDGNITLTRNGTVEFNQPHTENKDILKDRWIFLFVNLDDISDTINYTLSFVNDTGLVSYTLSISQEVGTLRYMKYDNNALGIFGRGSQYYYKVLPLAVNNIRYTEIPAYTETKPTTFQANSTGTYIFKLFVTDEVHPNEYTQQEIATSVVKCETFIDRDNVKVQGLDFNKGMNSLRTGIYSVCGTFDSILGVTKFGTCFGIVAIYTIVGLALAIGLGMIIRGLDASLSYVIFSLSWSIWMIFGSFWLNINKNFLILVVLVGVSGIIKIFTGIIFGSGSGVSE